MKTEYGYRYNLQFSNKTEQEKVVGEFLEKLGNKKSEFIVPMLYEYLAKRPELLQEKTEIQLEVTQTISKEEIEQLILKICNQLIDSGKIAPQLIPVTVRQNDIEQRGNPNAQKILNNLNKFKK